MNRNGTHRFIHLNAWPLRSGATVEGLEEEMCHCGGLWGFKGSSQAQCFSLSLFPYVCESGRKTLRPFSGTVSACGPSCFLHADGVSCWWCLFTIEHWLRYWVCSLELSREFMDFNKFNYLKGFLCPCLSFFVLQPYSLSQDTCCVRKLARRLTIKTTGAQYNSLLTSSGDAASMGHCKRKLCRKWSFQTHAISILDRVCARA